MGMEGQDGKDGEDGEVLGDQIDNPPTRELVRIAIRFPGKSVNCAGVPRFAVQTEQPRSGEAVVTPTF